MPTSSRKKRRDRIKADPAAVRPRQRACNSAALPIVCVLLVFAIIAVYAQSTAYDFITVDDSLYVTNNSRVKEGLTRQSVYWAFTGTGAGNWHPLTWISLMVEHSISDLNPSSFHRTNIALHVLNALLLLLVLRRLTGSLWRSAFVAALFALHPLHVESVAWISERKDVLSTLCWLSGIWLYFSYVKKPSAARYAALAGVFLLGIMAKPMLVTFPVTLLLLDIWPLQRLTFGTNRSAVVAKLVWEKTPLFAIAIGLSGPPKPITKVIANPTPIPTNSDPRGITFSCVVGCAQAHERLSRKAEPGSVGASRFAGRKSREKRRLLPISI